MKNILKKEEHKIRVIVEFNNINTNRTQQTIAKLSDYISDFILPNDKILTEFQSYQKGYRLVYNIFFTNNRWTKGKYTKELANLSDWLLYNNIESISSYQYNYV